MFKGINVQCLTRMSLANANSARMFLHELKQKMPEAFPVKYNYWEPIKNPVDQENIDAIFTNWQSPLLWKAQNRIYGSIWFSKNHYPLHDNVKINIPCKTNQEPLIRIAQWLAQKFCSDLTLINCIVENDIPFLCSSDAGGFLDMYTKRIFNFFITTHQLIKYLYNIDWIMIFGAPYIAHFGRKKLMSAPAYKVEEVAENQIMIQLSENYMDYVDHYEDVCKVREAVKRHLGTESFYDPKKGVDGSYIVPDFGEPLENT